MMEFPEQNLRQLASFGTLDLLATEQPVVQNISELWVSEELIAKIV
jgi:hypothetical protein